MKQGWELKKLSEVMKIQNGYAFNSKLFTIEEGMPLIRIRDIKEGSGTVTKFNGSYDKKYEVKAGDFLIGMDGEFGCYEWKGDTALLNQRVCRLQEFSNKLHSRFLFYGINKYLKAIEDVTAFATVKHISSKQIENIEIPLPPLKEQQRIVAILDEAFAVIAQAKANAEQNLKNAKELFESYLQSVFENKGEGWEDKTLGELCDIKHGFAFEGKDFETDYFGNNPIILTPGNFTENSKLIFNHKNTKRCFSNYPKEYEFTIGELVVVMTDLSSKMKILGKPAFIEIENILHNQRIGKFVFFDKTINKTFLFYILQTRKYLQCIKNSATGTMVRHTAPKRILDFNINLPPLKEQQSIVQKLDALSTETKQLEAIYQQKINDLDELKKSILQKAFAGELNTASLVA